MKAHLSAQRSFASKTSCGLLAAICLASLAACTQAQSAADHPGKQSAKDAAPPAMESGFSFPNGFATAAHEVRVAWAAAYEDTAINLTAGSTPHRAGAAWYLTRQNITSFTTDFTFQIKPPGSGITFCIQNYDTSTAAGATRTNAGGDANMLGYGAYNLANQDPILKSIAVKFDASAANGLLYSKNPPSATGLYINGGPAAALLPQIDLNPSGINLRSGDIMAAHMVYDGRLLTMILRDTNTDAQYRTSWPIDIRAATGSESAWIGFTGGTIPPASQNILSWTFRHGYEPRLPRPTFSIAAGQYTAGQSVSISAFPGARIYYTVDGREPTTSSHQYTGPISINSSEVIQAVAVKSGYSDSLVELANFQIAPSTTPIINFPRGFAAAAGLVAVNGSAEFSDAALQMTDAANQHEASSAWYVAPVNVTSFTTQFTMQFTGPQARALANGMTFTIQNKSPTATSNPYVTGGPNAVSIGDKWPGIFGEHRHWGATCGVAK